MKPAEPPLKQTVIQPPLLLLTVMDSLADSAVCRERCSKHGALGFYNRTMSRMHILCRIGKPCTFILGVNE